MLANQPLTAGTFLLVDDGFTDVVPACRQAAGIKLPAAGSWAIGGNKKETRERTNMAKL